jgi:hypothetical protein
VVTSMRKGAIFDVNSFNSNGNYNNNDDDDDNHNRIQYVPASRVEWNKGSSRMMR